MENENKAFSYNSFASLVSEASGSFVFIFLFMICTDKKTQYSDDKVINCFIMSSAYTAARLMSGGSLVTILLSVTEGTKKLEDGTK